MGGGGGRGRGAGAGGAGGEDKYRFIRRVGWIVAFFYACLGLIGYAMANSTTSLVGGACLSIPFAIASSLMELSPTLGVVFGLVFSIPVFAYCYNKYKKSRKLVPAGLLFGFSTWTLVSYAKVLVGF